MVSEESGRRWGQRDGAFLLKGGQENIDQAWDS